MFGFVMANLRELDPQQKARYQQVYCGICRGIRTQSGQSARLALSYDMAFLALLLMSLYEPQERFGSRGCILHPCKSRNWADNEYIRYAADMNVALGYYNALDDARDEGKATARLAVKALGKHCPEISRRYPRQCQAMEVCIAKLSRLEKEGCANPDEPAGCFGALMAELLVYREDLWADTLREMGMALGRFIYLADAAIDYRRDLRRHSYNPFAAMGQGEDWARWEQYLVLAIGRCTEHYERLPLVQDKQLLDNILYSGVWIAYRSRHAGGQEETHD